MDATPMNVLVTGAASGLGRCFALHYITRPFTQVIAVDRNEIELPEACATSSCARVHVDLVSAESIKDLIQSLGDRKLDLVIHVAGIRGLVSAVEREKPEDVQAAETLDVMDAKTMMDTLEVNSVGTFTLLQQLLPFVKKGDEANEKPAGKVIVMSSRMGSIASNKAGGSYAYRASKAAQNAIVTSMSKDVPDVTFALVHPGRVETGLTKCREEGAIEVDESTSDMIRLIGGLSAKDSGKFVDRFGEVIPW